MQDILDEHATTPKATIGNNQHQSSTSLTVIPTNSKPTAKTTALHPFWNDWNSVTQPTTSDQKNSSKYIELLTENQHQTTTEMPAKDFNHQSTTQQDAELLPWMEDVLNELSTTPTSTSGQLIRPSPLPATETSIWMQDGLNDHSTKPAKTTTPSSQTGPNVFSGDGTLIFGDGNGDLHLPSHIAPNR